MEVLPEKCDGAEKALIDRLPWLRFTSQFCDHRLRCRYHAGLVVRLVPCLEEVCARRRNVLAGKWDDRRARHRTADKALLDRAPFARHRLYEDVRYFGAATRECMRLACADDYAGVFHPLVRCTEPDEDIRFADGTHLDGVMRVNVGRARGDTD